jgi:tetratricopeptide (TPR) repeat protein
MSKRLDYAALILLALALSSCEKNLSSNRLRQITKSSEQAVYKLEIEAVGNGGRSIATAFGISADGLVVTNAHAMVGVKSATARAFNGASFEVIGISAIDKNADLAILKLRGTSFPFLKLGSELIPENGSEIAVIGSPLGLSHTLTKGVISAHRGEGEGLSYQISAAISPGSSGSPVFDVDGNVVAVAKSGVKDGDSLNFAIPIKFLVAMINSDQTSGPPTPFDSIELQTASFLEDPECILLLEKSRGPVNSEMLKLAISLAEKYPNVSIAHALLAEIYDMLAFKEESIKSLLKAIDLQPENAKYWLDLGAVLKYSGEKNRDLAKKAFTECIKLDPLNIEAFMGLGEVMSFSDSLADRLTGVEFMKEGLKIDPDLDRFNWITFRIEWKTFFGGLEIWSSPSIGITDPEKLKMWEEVEAYKRKLHYDKRNELIGNWETMIREEFSHSSEAWLSLAWFCRDELRDEGRTREYYERAAKLAIEDFEADSDPLHEIDSVQVGERSHQVSDNQADARKKRNNWRNQVLIEYGKVLLSNSNRDRAIELFDLVLSRSQEEKYLEQVEEILKTGAR